MQTVLRIISSLTALTVVLTSQQMLKLMSGAEAAPAEGLTPYSFFMARAYGEPAEHPVMRFISFKPNDGAKFRETFEKKHGPRGRDLIDSLGRGSYQTATPTATSATDLKSKIVIAGAASTGSKSVVVKNPAGPQQNHRKRSNKTKTDAGNKKS